MNEPNPYAPPVARVADVTAIPAAEPPFFAVGIFKFVLMSLCTLSLYEVYWFYRNWKVIKARRGLDIYPFWRAFFAFFFCYQCFVEIRDYDDPALDSGELLAGPLAAGWIIVTLLWRLPEPYWLVSFLAFVFLIPVQRRVNQINRAVEPTHAPNTRFSWLNWVGIVVGGLTFVLSIVGTFLPPEP